MLNIKDATEAIKGRVRLGDVASRYTTLKRGGNAGEYVGLCPLHKEKSPSFRVNEAEGFYYCFGCKANGDAISLVKAKENLDFMGAVQFLANQYNIDLKEFEVEGYGERDENHIPTSMYQTAIDAVIEMFRGTPESDQVCRRWFDTRKVPLPFIDLAQAGVFYLPKGGTMRVARLLQADQPGQMQEVFKDMGLFWFGEDRDRSRPPFCPYDERIILPVTRYGKNIAFTASILERGEAIQDRNARKYINSNNYRLFNKGNDVYGIDRARLLAKEYPDRPLIVAEGAIDAEALLQSGFPAISCLGTAINASVISRLAPVFPSIAVVLDNDDAGRKGSVKLAQEILAQNRQVNLSFLKAQEDPDELIAHQGAQGVFDLLKNPVGALDYVIEYTIRAVMSNLPQHDRKNVAMVKRMFLNEMLPQLHDYESNPSHYAMVLRISERTSVEVSVLTRMLHEGVKSAEKAIRTEVRKLPPSQLTSIHVRDRRLLALIKYYPRAWEGFTSLGLSAHLHPVVRELCEVVFQHAAKPHSDLREMLRERLDDDGLTLALELYTLASRTFRNHQLELDTLVVQYQAGTSQSQQVTGEQSLTALYHLTSKYRDVLASGEARPLQVAAATALSRGSMRQLNLLDNLSKEAAAITLPTEIHREEPRTRAPLLNLEVEGAEIHEFNPHRTPPPRVTRTPDPTPEPTSPAPWEDDDTANFL